MSVKISSARRSFSMKTGRDAEIRFKRAAEALGLSVTKFLSAPRVTLWSNKVDRLSASDF